MDEQVKYLIFVPLAAVIGASYLVSVPVNAGNEAPKDGYTHSPRSGVSLRNWGVPTGPPAPQRRR